MELWLAFCLSVRSEQFAQAISLLSVCLPQEVVPVCKDVFEVQDYPTRAFVFQLVDLDIQSLAK